MPTNETPRPLRAGLPPLPPKMTYLPIDERGYPVPYFVEWVNGKPDHRIVDRRRMESAMRSDLCWLCGHKLGVYRSFVIGPMCAVTLTSAEPPSHLECARYATQACPFLTRPHAHRREAGLPDNRVAAPGNMLKRNPGVTCIWTTRTYKPFRVAGGVLFEIGDPIAMEWVCEGRPATIEEIDESIESGLPALFEQAKPEGPEAMEGLERALERVIRQLDAQFGVTS